MIYEGIGPNRGRVLENDADALAYGLAVHGLAPAGSWDEIDPEFTAMFLEWEFSGNWVQYPTWEAFYSPCGEPLAGGETRTQVSGTPTLTARAPGGEHACGGQFAHPGKWGTGESDPRRDGMRDVQQSMPAGTRNTNAGSYLEPRRDVPSAGGMDGVNPCYGCGARAPDCHALCPQYADWSRENQAERARRQKQARREYAGVEEAVKRSDKARKKRRNG